MSGDLFLIRNGDGEEIGPASSQTIAVMISEGAITADAFVVKGDGLLPISQVPRFAEALGKVSSDPKRRAIASVLFTSDLDGPAEGREPLETKPPELPTQKQSGTSEQLLGTKAIDP